jgi:hypothetical protein
MSSKHDNVILKAGKEKVHQQPLGSDDIGDKKVLS